MIKILQQTDDN